MDGILCHYIIDTGDKKMNLQKPVFENKKQFFKRKMKVPLTGLPIC